MSDEGKILYMLAEELALPFCHKPWFFAYKTKRSVVG